MNKKIILQYISDIHLEIRSGTPNIKKLAENLVLLGDIGDPLSKKYKRFISECSKNHKNVFLLYGNHEYYNNDIKYNANSAITMGEKNKYFNNCPYNVYNLNNKVYYLNDNNDIFYEPIANCVKLIGTTLWSDISNDTVNYLNDYRKIYKSEKTLLTPEDTRTFFKINKSFILDELKKEQDIPTVILTHHGVNDLCNGKYINSTNKSGFTTNIPELSNFNNVIACINGHTHSNINATVPDTNIKLLSNCMGYPGEPDVGYNPEALLTIDI